MSLISDKELKALERALTIAAFNGEDALMILKGMMLEKNAEIRRLQEENAFILKRLEELEKEANKGAYY